MKRWMIIVSLVSLAVLLLAVPAQAITFGQPDGNQHPNVGALVYEWEGVKDIACSGTLISPTVFLTAAHCVNWMPRAGIPQDEVWVTFDEIFSADATLLEATYYINPLYGLKSYDPQDVAVLVLDEPVSGITPATLPAAGLLDQMKADGALKGQPFVAVGYGTVRDDKTKGPHALYWEGNRRYADQTFMALTKDWLDISMNPSTGDGGTCYGDSGGPHFLGDTGMVVSLTVTGDRFCRATDKTYRLDTPSARAYLDDFVTLP